MLLFFLKQPHPALFTVQHNSNCNILIILLHIIKCNPCIYFCVFFFLCLCRGRCMRRYLRKRQTDIVTSLGWPESSLETALLSCLEVAVLGEQSR